MQRWLQALEQRLLFYGKRAGVKLFAGFLAALLVGLGIGFVVYGLWQLAAAEWGPVAGAFVLGAVFIVLGAVVLWAGTLHRRTPPPLPPPAFSSPQSASIVALVEAFLLGLSAGKNRGRKHESPPPERDDS